MAAFGDSFNFVGHFEVQCTVVENISDRVVIAQAKDKSLYALHFFTSKTEAMQVNKDFSKLESFNIVRGYVVGKIDNNWVLAAPLPKIKTWAKWVRTNPLQFYTKVIYPFAIIPEKVKILIRKIADAIRSIHKRRKCHGYVRRSLLIGENDTVFLIPSTRNETNDRIQDDLYDYEFVINDLFKRIPGCDDRIIFQKEIFSELCALGKYFVDRSGPRSKRNFSELLLSCPLDWRARQRQNFMAMISVEKCNDINEFTKIFSMDTYPAELLDWASRLPSKNDTSPLNDVYSYWKAPLEYKRITGFVEYRKNLEGHARDYEHGITGDEVEDLFFYRWPDVVFKLYYIIVHEICTGPIPEDRLLYTLYQ